MSVQRPDFVDSPFFVMEEDNWHLKPGAPQEVQREFDAFMKNDTIDFSFLEKIKKDKNR